MSDKFKNPKEIKQHAVSTAILEVIEKEGLLGVTHSKIARKAGVSRAWIYEYMGNEKADLIAYAADVFAGHFARAEMTTRPTNLAELEARLRDGTKFALAFAVENPVIVKLHFRFRGGPTAIGAVIDKYEHHWLEQTQKNLVTILNLSSNRAAELAELLITLRLGFSHRLVTAANPELVRERARGAFDLIYAAILNASQGPESVP